jgi:hypothetical protein
MIIACFLIYGAGVEPRPQILQPFITLVYQSWTMHDDVSGAISEMNEWQGIPKYSEETRRNATLATTDPTWLEQGSNPGRREWRPANNRLIYGTTSAFYLTSNTKHRRIQQNLNLYNHSPIRLHDVLLNKLSTRTILPLR